MRVKTVIGTTAAAMLLGIGFLAGSAIGLNQASAQTSSATPPAANATPGPSNGPAQGVPRDGFGRHGGFKGGDFGGFDMKGPHGHGGAPATAEGANNVITKTTTLINLVKSDLAYANGKMDTGDVQKWVNGADALLKSAQTAVGASRFEQAVAYARAAGELAETADHQMAQKLGADKLPSYSQAPRRFGKGLPTGTTVTQAQASRVLAGAYNRLLGLGAVLKGASGQASGYLTDAQNAYKAAYSAYQAGNYNDAVASARLAERLAGVAGQVQRAETATGTSDAPVTVPAPNF